MDLKSRLFKFLRLVDVSIFFAMFYMQRGRAAPIQLLFAVSMVSENRQTWLKSVFGLSKTVFFSKIDKSVEWIKGFRIMIAACDTFRAGAVEQLKTHVHRINGVHADSVKLFEQGYGKDPATIAMHAISAARDQGYDVCLIDTAGRMQVFCDLVYEFATGAYFRITSR